MKLSNTVIVNIRITDEESDSIKVAEQLCDHWGVRDQPELQVQLGQNGIAAHVRPIASQAAEIILSRKQQKQLSLPFPCSLHAKLEDSKLRLGPVIGILTMNYSAKPHLLFQKEKNNRFFRELLLPVKNEAALFFLFNRRDIDWSSKTVTGVFLQSHADETESWKRFTVPFPEVVYNRINSRKFEISDEFRKLKEKMSTIASAQMFNPYFFNKKDIHSRLVSHPRIRPFIPETRTAPALTEIQELLEKYHIVYLKPDAGSSGKDIYKVSVMNGMEYVCQYHNGSQNVQVAYSNLSLLIEQHIGEKLSVYLVQQGIVLAKVDQCPFDFRVHLNKNIHNQWVVSGMAAKIASVDSVTTHERTGGIIVHHLEALRRAFGDRAYNLETRVMQVSIRAGSAIEESFGCPIGELGLDIGVDVNGHIWIFEINSKPGRVIFTHESLQQSGDHSIRQLIEYGRYLANFKD